MHRRTKQKTQAKEKKNATQLSLVGASYTINRWISFLHKQRQWSRCLGRDAKWPDNDKHSKNNSLRIEDGSPNQAIKRIKAHTQKRKDRIIYLTWLANENEMTTTIMCTYISENGRQVERVGVCVPLSVLSLSLPSTGICYPVALTAMKKRKNKQR